MAPELLCRIDKLVCCNALMFLIYVAKKGKLEAFSHI